MYVNLLKSTVLPTRSQSIRNNPSPASCANANSFCKLIASVMKSYSSKLIGLFFFVVRYFAARTKESNVAFFTYL